MRVSGSSARVFASIALAAAVASAPLAAATVVIDDFSTAQGPLTGVAVNHADGGGILGGERSVLVNADGSLTVTGGALTFSSADANDSFSIFYDGNNDGTGDQTGLAAQDLTGGGTNHGIRLTVTASNANNLIAVRIDSSATLGSCGAVMVTGAGNFDVPFGTLTPCGSGGAADLTQAGQIVVNNLTTTTGWQITIDSIEAVAGAPVALQGFTVE
jgi:hypothetical protein